MPRCVVGAVAWLAIGSGLAVPLAAQSGAPLAASFEAPDRERLPGDETTTSLKLVSVPSSVSGLTVAHHAGGEGDAKRLMIECVGAGLGLFDVDDDGDLDAYLVQGGAVPGDGVPRGEADALFLNDGSGRFTRDTTSRTATGFGCGVTAGDVDGDGDEDLFVASLGPNALLVNDGGRLAPAASGHGTEGDADDWSMAGAFADVDRDGDLDLYVTNYLHHDPEHPLLAGAMCRWMGCQVPCGPKGLTPQPDRLLVNDGAGRFSDVTQAAGLADVPPGYAFQAVFTDMDDDGDADLFVANDSVPNRCFVNLGPGPDGLPRFIEQGMEVGLALSSTGREQAGMGVAVGDLDGDLRDDLVMTNFSREQNAVFLNASAGGDGVMFFDEAGRTGLGRPSYFDLGWGANLFDADLDGDRELYVANGHVYPHVDACGLSNVAYEQSDRLFEQEAPGRFRDVSAWSGIGETTRRACRGSAAGDLDGDGDVDLLVSVLDGEPLLLRNDSVRAGSWIVLDLRPPVEAVGARVVLSAAGRLQSGEVRRGSSFLCTEDRRLHFGLPEVGPVEAQVRWPDGHVEVFADLTPDAVVRLRRGEGRP